ncbi:uncharacterized protein LOC142765666 [Rhipicephalus microplus]|uniref:uncharacterized protein LOC142765666 n=1 Tax=Rhipicephalus microplus TaxID=6941 RepID=UPI003F6B514C
MTKLFCHTDSDMSEEKKIAEPLTHLRKSNVKFMRESAQLEAFQERKECLQASPILAHFDEYSETEYSLRLQELDVTVVYKSGTKYSDADCLSRAPVKPPLPNGLNEDSFLRMTTADYFAEKQRADSELRSFVKHFEAPYTGPALRGPRGKASNSQQRQSRDAPTAANSGTVEEIRERQCIQQRSNEATVLTQRQESMQQASQVLPKSSEARTLELEIQKLKLQIQYEKLLQAIMNAERLNGTLSNSGLETGDQRRGGFDSVQQCAKVLKGFRLPSDADVPLWFEEVEKLFATYQVPHESRVHLVIPALTERVRYLLRNLNPEESADYESVKAAVLTELKLSAAEYLLRFERAVKRKEETWAQFASRVKTYFSYYLQVREADTVEVMAELMVADRIKSGLSTEGLEYVRLREGEGWLRPTEIAKVLQTFEQAKGKGRASKQPTVEMGQKPATRVEKGALKCHLCHGSGHFAKECPKASDKENNPKKATEPKRKVQKVTLSHETDTEIPIEVLSAKVKSLKHEGEGTDKLQLIPVSCAGISADAILDTGSEITVIRESLLPRSVVEPSGTVRLVSAFGKTIEARLATLPVKLNSPREVTKPQNVDLLCALTDELVEGTDCLLTKDDWKLLLKASSPLAPCRAPAEPAHEAEQAVEKQKVVACNLTLEEKDDSGEKAQTDEEREASLGQRVEFRNVQLGDTTLKKSHADSSRRVLEFSGLEVRTQAATAACF